MRQSYVHHMKTSLKYTVTRKKQEAEPFLLKGNHNTNSFYNHIRAEENGGPMVNTPQIQLAYSAEHSQVMFFCGMPLGF